MSFVRPDEQTLAVAPLRIASLRLKAYNGGGPVTYTLGRLVHARLRLDTLPGYVLPLSRPERVDCSPGEWRVQRNRCFWSILQGKYCFLHSISSAEPSLRVPGAGFVDFQRLRSRRIGLGAIAARLERIVGPESEK